jgi:hypothetical protein
MIWREIFAGIGAILIGGTAWARMTISGGAAFADK